MEHTLIVAGIGPGDPDYILPKAQKAIEGAHYLVGGRRALSDYAKPSQETYPVTGKLSLLASWLEAVSGASDRSHPGDFFCAGLLRSCQRALAGGAVAVFPWPCAGREGYGLYARTKAGLSDGS